MLHQYIMTNDEIQGTDNDTAWNSNFQHCYNFELLSDSSLYSCLVLGKLSIVYSRFTRF